MNSLGYCYSMLSEETQEYARDFRSHPTVGMATAADSKRKDMPMYIIVDDTNDDDVIRTLPRQPINKTPYRRRQSICGESYNPETDDAADDERVIHPKTDEQRRSLTSSISGILLFRCLDNQQMQAVVDAMFEAKVQAGSKIIKQGDDGDYFYVIQSGVFDVLVSKREEVDSQPERVHQFNESGCFGELALLYNMPRAATIVAVTDGVLWAMDRQSFRHIVLRSAFLKRKTYEHLLQSVPILSSLDSYERLNLADALVSKTYSKGQCIIREGDAADGMYFIEEGEVVVTIRKKGKETEVKKLKKGLYFGEMALVEHSKRTASVYAASPAVTVAYLERDSFERLLGPCLQIMKRTMSTYKRSS